MRAAALRLLAGAAIVAATSCSNGVPSADGTAAYMQIAGARFIQGPMPAGSAGGPLVEQITLVDNNIWPGLGGDVISGALDPTAAAAAIGLQGDFGYWIATAGVPSVSTPTFPSFLAGATFAEGIIPGNYTLAVRAVDAAGNYGPPSTQILIAESSPTDPPPVGDLVVTLTWDTESNLDLSVVDPNGTEIDWNKPSSEPPFPAAATAGGSFGYLDYDSNANCVIDGLRREDAIWPMKPPSGPYTVRVDAASLCGQPIAYWTVRVLLQGSLIAQASGVALDADTMGSHGPGSGVLALQFSVP